MRDTLKRLVKLTAGFSPVTFLGPLTLIFLTPLYTRVLTPADYGVVDVTLTLVTLLTVFVTFGLDQALNSFFFDGDLAYQRKLVTTIWLYLLAVGAVVALALVVFATPLAILLFNDASRRFVVYLVAVNVMAAPVYGTLAAVLRLQLRVRSVNILGIFNVVVLVAANVLMVLVLRMKATGTVLANTTANLASCLLVLFLARAMLRGNFCSALLKPAWVAGSGLLIGVLGNTILVSGDRLLMTQYVSPASIGLYSIANKLAMLLSVMVTGLWMGWMPMALAMGHDEDAPRQYARVYELIVCLTLVGALTLGLFAPEILSVFTTSSYVPAAPYAALLMFYTGPITSTSNSFAIGLFVGKRTYLLSIAVVVAAAVNVAVNLWLLPKLDIWGAVIATLAAGLVWAALAYIFSQRTLLVPYRWRRVVGVMTVYAILLGIYLLAPGLFSWFAKLGSIALLTAAVPAFGIVTWADMDAVWQAIVRRVRDQVTKLRG